MPSLNPSAQQLAHYAEAMPAGTPSEPEDRGEPRETVRPSGRKAPSGCGGGELALRCLAEHGHRLGGSAAAAAAMQVGTEGP